MNNMSVITSLWELLNQNDNRPEIIKNVNSITIPKIQRDYAQGRDDKECTDKRQKFLIYLYENITGNDNPTLLDFIYGSVENGSMLPLDGQQRLTTLFLLHVYAYKLNNTNDEKIKENLKNFSYDTRETSKKFCKSIVDEEFKIPDNSKESLKKIIENQMWYFDTYKFDQTIQAMLNTLDDIHHIFYDNFKDSKEQLWKILTQWKKEEENNDRNIGKIRFHYLDLGEFKLSDDLYIKMNARGKILTNFENLRAEIIELVKSEDNKNNKQFLIDENDEFAKKTDVDWTNLLWKIRNTYTDLKDINYLIDYAYMRIFAACIMTYTEHSKHGENILKNLNKTEQITDLIDYFLCILCHRKDANPEHDIKRLSDEQRRAQNILDEFKNILNTVQMFEDMEGNVDKDKLDYFTKKVKFWYFENNRNPFRDLVFVNKPTKKVKIWEDEKKKIPASATYISRVLFLAQMWYFSQTKDYKLENEQNYNDWMRVVRNFVEFPDPQIVKNESREDVKMREPIYVIDAIEVIKTLAGTYDNRNNGLGKFSNIYKVLADDNSDRPCSRINKSYSSQYDEEIAKAKVIAKNETIYVNNEKISKKDILFQLEDNYLLRGSIAFPLYCLGYNVYSSNFSWNTFDLESIDWKKLYHISEVLNTYFKDETLPNNFRKAMLLCPNDNNEYIDYVYSQNKQTKIPTNAFFVNSIDLQYILRTDKVQDTKCCFKNLILKLADNSFEEIINQTVPQGISNLRKNLFKTWEDNKYKPYIYFENETKPYLEEINSDKKIYFN
ncbi:MAG: DUF262 domain-containing protein [Cyanobacteria bacterium RUI128]|nr:DUF262 domain-containing protein [Cyanobacteria bacterium RUI128]